MSRKTIKRAAVAALCVAAIIAGAVILKRVGIASLLPKVDASAEEIEMAPKTLKFRVEAAGLLRATSVQNYGGPPAFGTYWQFQIVSMSQEGNNVKSGDMLVQFDAQKLREDMQQYQNELDQATKELDKTKVQIDLERKDLESKLAAAENKYEKAKLKQSTVESLAKSSDIEMDRLALEQARREVEALKSRLDWHKKSSDATYQIIASKKARAENKVRELTEGMSSFQIKAAGDGVLIYKTKWNGEKFKVGENIWSGQPVVEIPDLNSIIAEGFVPEVDVGRVKLGQRAEISIDAFPDKTYSGTVKSMGKLIRPKAWDIPNKVLDVQVAIDELDISLMRPAMSLKIKVETGAIENCLAVPLKAVRVTADGAKVKLKSDTGWKDHAVKLGESNGEEVIVTEGLKPGDRILSDFSKARAE